MKYRNILLADNDPVDLAICSEFLESAGYRVVKAGNPAEARDILERFNIHLAILDLRLTNDEEKDRSGLLLAKEFAPSTPKIILTKFPTYEDVRDAMRLDQRPLPPAIDFVDKRKDLNTLLDAVNQAFTQHVRINWHLSIEWKIRDTFSLVKQIEPYLEGEYLLNRAEEFEDLLRRVFYEKDHIRIQHLLWEQDGRVALVIIAFKEGGQPEAFSVVCGKNALIAEEAHKFHDFAPKAPGETGTELTVTKETTHFAANAYWFVNLDLEKVQSLNELYRFALPKIFKDSLITLFDKTLSDWHQDQISRVEVPPESMYRQRLQIPKAFEAVQFFEERLRTIEKKALEHRLRIERANEEVSFSYEDRTFVYQNPSSLLSQGLNSTVALTIIVPGDISGENVLADQDGNTWLTNFIAAGQAPLFWNHVGLESIIRFDWLDTNNFLRQQEFENCFVNGDFAKPFVRDLEPEVHKPAQAIMALRKLAARIVGQDETDYHLGVFFQAAHRLAEFNPATPLSNSDFMRLIHIYISMAMLTSRILGDSPTKTAPESYQADEIIILDRKSRLILVGGRKVQLTRQYFTVFEFLFDRAGVVCTKEELVNEALQGKYNHEYIHTLVMRIRKEIEDDPERPRYLITESSAGYRLIINPK